MTKPTLGLTKPTLVTFLLDRSYSMLKVKDGTIEAFNGYVAGLQDEKEADIDFTFLQFDTESIDKVCVAIPVKEAQMLTEATYQPRGGTPLIEAAIKTIHAVATSLHKRRDNPKVVICIQTDGEENSSAREYNWEVLRGLVAEKQAQGWQFNFLGAGIDAYVQGSMMGIGIGQTMSYDATDKVATRNAFMASAANAASFAAGRVSTTEYTLSQKRSSGDAYIPKGLHEKATLPPKPANPALDLTPHTTQTVTTTTTTTVRKTDLEL